MRIAIVKDNRDLLANNLSSLLSSILGALYLYRIERTLLGILLGLVIHVTSDVVLLGDIAWIDTQKLTWMNSLILSLGLMYLPLIVKQLLAKDNESEFDEKIENRFRIIERAKKAGLPESEAAELYLELCRNILNQVDLKMEDARELDKSEPDQEPDRGE